jgi:hypothetical protein
MAPKATAAALIDMVVEAPDEAWLAEAEAEAEAADLLALAAVAVTLPVADAAEAAAAAVPEMAAVPVAETAAEAPLTTAKFQCRKD